MTRSLARYAGGTASRTPHSATQQNAESSTPSSALEQLAAAFWEGELEARPVSATSLGDRRFDHLLDDNTAAGR